jgi:glycogen debranching enzyme
MPMISRCSRLFALYLVVSISLAALAANPEQSLPELSRPVRSFEFLPVVGTRAALFGSETGNFEAWVYPLKLVRNFRFNVLTEGHTIPSDVLARTLTVRPESATIVYSGDTFSIRETMFAPVHEPGIVISFDIDTAQPLELEAVFERDFQLEWPAAVGGTYMNWDPALKAFYLGEERHRYSAFIGSPSSSSYSIEYFTNYSQSRQSSFRLGVIGDTSLVTPTSPSQHLHDSRVIVIAASMQGPADAEKVYHHLLTDRAALLKDSAAYYADYLGRTVSLALPDSRLQSAYDWARVSELQGLVENPFLGVGLVAGYRTSGDYERPGFAWFFGRDSLWTDLALDSVGDFATTRTALDFLSKFQRADGKVEHEIAQAASLVDWFNDYPHAYASADATPLYIIVMNDYVVRSGDTAFAKDKWPSVLRAYQFLRSTYGSEGYPRNFGVGHGWIEGGPFLPVRTELYQAALAAEAIESLSSLAMILGRNDAPADLSASFKREQAALNIAFWSADKRAFGYALDAQGKRVDVGSVLSTVPMWFGLLESDQAQTTIDQLAADDHQTDWGMRIVSGKDPRYDPGGYHYGAVWPLFTGWASVAEYRYHRTFPAYDNLRANALLPFEGSLGHFSEVLSGDHFQELSTSSPHQIWSAAMVVSPLLRGMLGLEENALTHTLAFSPHFPADWTSVRVSNVHCGDTTVNLFYSKTAQGISLEVERSGPSECTLTFSPALSPRAEVASAELSGHHIQTNVVPSSQDRHVVVSFPIPTGESTLRIHIRNDFGLSHKATLPAIGGTSCGLRVTNAEWNASRDALTLKVSGLPGSTYDLAVWDPAQIVSVEGGQMAKDDEGREALRVTLAGPNSGSYTTSTVTVHFGKR